MPEIRSVIHGITPERAEKMKHGGRYEVVFDHLTGGADGLEAHFRLVGENATQQITVGGLAGSDPVMDIQVQDVVTTFRYGKPEHRTRTGRLLNEDELARLAGQGYGPGIHERLERYSAAERARFPMRTLDTDSGIVTTEYPAAELFMARASDLLAAMISMAKISPLVLGIPSGDEALSVRLYKHLTGTEPAGD